MLRFGYMSQRYEAFAKKILDQAGVEINGPNPWDIQVHNPDFFQRVMRQGSLGLGESYMDGWWDVSSLDEFFARLLRSRLREAVRFDLPTILLFIRSRLSNMQSRQRATIVARQHYDLSTKLYTSFLDPFNQYTCGYFKNTTDLNIAQEQKLDLICKKLQLKAGDRVLDIGCGWGGFAKFAASRYGVHVTGLTISKEQLAYAREFTKGLSVDIKLQDYRDASGTFDKVLICGMIEHVGFKNYPVIIEKVKSVLKQDGLFLLHTIGGNRSVTNTDPWLNKYIFPNSMLPSIAQLAKAFERRFVVEDWHNFGAYYDPTLMAWFANFEKNWPSLKADYDERFYRMWKYYLLSCAGLFRARYTQLWQIVLSPQGVSSGYQSVR
jgi:cyclopropane-fatty-acyl-phospholipid synthase